MLIGLLPFCYSIWNKIKKDLLDTQGSALGLQSSCRELDVLIDNKNSLFMYQYLFYFF